VVLGPQQPGVCVLQCDDLLPQVVAHRVQARSRGLLLGGAQRQKGRERADRQDERQHRRSRHPPGHEHQERYAADRRHHPLPQGPEGGDARQVVNGQRSPRHRRRREGSEQEVAGRDGDHPAPPVGSHAQSARGHGQEQPDHGDRVHLTGEQRQQDAAAQDHAFVDQDLHAPIIGDHRRSRARRSGPHPRFRRP